MFSKNGVIVVEKDENDEDKLMEAALESGAIDFIVEDEAFVIYTEPNDLGLVRDELEKRGYDKFVSVQVEMLPSTYTTIQEEEIQVKMQKLLDMLEDNDDVQNVWHNWEIDE